MDELKITIIKSDIPLLFSSLKREYNQLINNDLNNVFFDSIDLEIIEDKIQVIENVLNQLKAATKNNY